MSDSEATPSPASVPMPDPTRKKPVKPPRPPRRGPGMLAPLAFLLALLALAAVAWLAWQGWQERAVRASRQQALAQVSGSVHDLRQQLNALRDEDASRRARQASRAQAQAAALDQRLQGLEQRTTQLEQGVRQLARGSAAGGRKALLLDQAEMLLRMGAQRYHLFHDAPSAVHAYAMAERLLQAARDPSLNAVERAAARERQALAASSTQGRAEDAAGLEKLRLGVADWPLKTVSGPTGAPVHGFWKRLWHGLSRTLEVRRVDQQADAARLAGLVRPLTALSLARAEAARLAGNARLERQALQQADAYLAAWFDGHDPAVQKARAELARRLAQPSSDKVELGAALRQLESLRGMDDLAPSAPARAGSTAGAHP